MSTIDVGWRLDRLSVSRFHWRVLALIAAGMFFDSFDLYLAGGVLGALVQSGEIDAAAECHVHLGDLPGHDDRRLVRRRPG